MSRTRLEIAIANLEFARKYTISLLQDLSDADWLTIPDSGVTNIAWQVGHLAMAEYALTMIRVRGKEPSDKEFISNDFFKRFKKGSKPSSVPDDNPPLAVIRETFDRVHERALDEMTRYDDECLGESLPEPHAVFATKLGSIFFCSDHEMLHAGQIGLLRRMLGKPPIR